ncbi:glycosyltransferase [Carboxydocella sp. ULO1]|uniref:glycosyltransferase n=1 Tax=Carboxydocella sp. ULO1 TaxID=1926599 RepID=UPI001356504C|nr:glycosyltransferase [Carboxydocella sp. ULO1]
MEGKTIIILGVTAWNDIRQRPQHFAVMLARKNKVIYFNPIVSPFTVIQGKIKRGVFPKVFSSEGVIIIDPPLLCPFSNKIRLINKFNATIFSLFFRGMINEKIDILWVTSPIWADVVGNLKSNHIVFDCMDNYPEFFVGREKRNFENLEKKLVVCADVIITSSQELYSKIKERYNRSSDVFLILNGVEVENFLPAIKYDTPNIENPVIGFVGNIGAWVDLDLIEFLAIRNPQWDIRLIGPINQGIKYRSKMKNVKFIGPVNYYELASFMREFDIAIIPFKKNELTKYVNPVKIWEYLAAGKPVVSIGIPSPCPDHLCRTSENYEGFEANIKRFLSANSFSQEKIKERVNFARDNSWEKRFEEIEIILSKMN